jgi:hypothetical protein
VGIGNIVVTIAEGPEISISTTLFDTLLIKVTSSIAVRPAPRLEVNEIVLLNVAENGHRVMSYSVIEALLYIHNLVVVCAISGLPGGGTSKYELRAVETFELNT